MSRDNVIRGNGWKATIIREDTSAMDDSQIRYLKTENAEIETHAVEVEPGVEIRHKETRTAVRRCSA